MGLVGVVIVCRWVVWVGRVVLVGRTVQQGQGRQEAAVHNRGWGGGGIVVVVVVVVVVDVVSLNLNL